MSFYIELTIYNEEIPTNQESLIPNKMINTNFEQQGNSEPQHKNN
jgi:hypothetical protein